LDFPELDEKSHEHLLEGGAAKQQERKKKENQWYRHERKKGSEDEIFLPYIANLL
jgi:hypothetical protein